MVEAVSYSARFSAAIRVAPGEGDKTQVLGGFIGIKRGEQKSREMLPKCLGSAHSPPVAARVCSQPHLPAQSHLQFDGTKLTLYTLCVPKRRGQPPALPDRRQLNSTGHVNTAAKSNITLYPPHLHHHLIANILFYSRHHLLAKGLEYGWLELYVV